MNEKYLDDALIEAFGSQITDDIEIIKRKFGAVVGAHLFAGTAGDSTLCELNRILEKLINR